MVEGRSGTLVSIEGLDGSGKDTVLDGLSDVYDDAVLTKEPTDTWTGDVLRTCLSEDTNPLMDLHYFLGDRLNHIDSKINPALDDGTMVICSRYVDSTRAYQSVALSNAGQSIGNARNLIEQMMSEWIIEPDLTIYIDIPVEEAIERASGDEKYENEEFLKSVRKEYRLLIQSYPERFAMVNGLRSREEVLNDVIRAIEEHQ